MCKSMVAALLSPPSLRSVRIGVLALRASPLSDSIQLSDSMVLLYEQPPTTV